MYSSKDIAACTATVVGFVFVLSAALRVPAPLDEYDNCRRYALAVTAYGSDNDDRVPPVQYNNTYSVVQNDQVVGNLITPYKRGNRYLVDPDSPVALQDRVLVDMLPLGSVPPERRMDQVFFNIAVKSDFGYNAQYFSLMGANCPENGGTLPFKAFPIRLTEVANLQRSIVCVNSIWNRDGDSPVGGGSWALDPPCRQYKDPDTGAIKDTFPPLPAGCTGRWWFGGWNPGSGNWNEWGGMWPFYHAGLVATGFADGHMEALTVPETSKGCDVKTAWSGYIFDRDLYLWDTQ